MRYFFWAVPWGGEQLSGGDTSGRAEKLNEMNPNEMIREMR